MLRLRPRYATRRRLRATIGGSCLGAVLLCAAGGAVPAVASAACANDALRIGPSAALSDCRAYEKVSPLDKNGGDVDRDLTTFKWATTGASPDGSAVAYPSLAQFAGNSSGAVMSQYRSRRGAAGWTTLGVDPPLAPEGPTSTPTIELFSSDLSKLATTTNARLNPGDEQLLNNRKLWALYLRDDSQGAASYQLLSKPFEPLPQVSDSAESNRDPFYVSGATADLGHVVFGSFGRQLTAEGLPPDDPLQPINQGLYEWSDGQLRFVSVLPDGTPAQFADGGAGTGSLSLATVSSPQYPGDHLISDDGGRIYFTVRGTQSETSGTLYVRENGATTREVGAGRFLAAKASDGSLALFADPLNGDLFLWDATAPSGSELTNLTPGVSGGAGVLGLAAAADDLSQVYFVATGELATGAASGEPNLYRWAPDEGIRLVRTLDGGDGSVWSTTRTVSADSTGSPYYRDARVSGDGSRLLFTSRRQLTSSDSGGHKQVYLYDEASDEVQCVSCDPAGAASSADSELYPVDFSQPTGGATTAPYRLPKNLSADGQRAFFETTQALVPGDVNGNLDVYGWQAGQLQLISTGKAGGRSEFVAAGANGDDVFFTTRERLVGSDVDNQVDVYDARVNGGFAEPTQPLPCQGEACQGLPSMPPLAKLPGSSTFEGRGNETPAKPATLGIKRLSAGQRRLLASGKSAVLRVRVSRAGKVSVSGTARLGGRQRIVTSASKRASKAGTVTLRLRLTKPARSRLQAGHALGVRLTARLAGAAEPQTYSLTLRTKGASR